MKTAENTSKIRGKELLAQNIEKKGVKPVLARWFSFSGECVDILTKNGLSEKDALRALKSLLTLNNIELMR